MTPPKESNMKEWVKERAEDLFHEAWDEDHEQTLYVYEQALVEAYEKGVEDGRKK